MLPTHKIGMCIENANKTENFGKVTNANRHSPFNTHHRNRHRHRNPNAPCPLTLPLPLPLPHPLHACPLSMGRIANANAMVIKSLKFSSEIMALIKHLLVACLLREYQCEEQQVERAEEPKLAKNVAAFGESASKRCGSETKAILKATTEIGAANAAAAVADAAAAWQVEEEKLEQVKEPEPGIVECVKAVAGQPQRRSTSAAAVEKATQRYTKRCRMAAATTETGTTTTASAGQTTIAPTSVSTNVAMATAASTPTETETLATSSSSPSQAELSKAEIFHLPKNCVLQKILHLQLLVKVSDSNKKKGA